MALWLCAGAAGLAGMAAYANRPGTPASAPDLWPVASQLEPDPSRPTLVMLAHPLCDCTKASLAELAELLARAPGRARVYVVFLMPAAQAAQWEDSALLRSARALPGVITIKDDGREMRLFGAATSGQMVLYGADRRRLFAGGATIARGHEGDNPGLEAMLAILSGGQPAIAQAPVFGCALSASNVSGDIRP